MAHAYANLHTHVIFSTKDRKAIILPEWKVRLLAYMGGIIREMHGQALTINGMADHVHLLLWTPPVLAISEALRVLKANSSRWVNQELGLRDAFAWQTGYGAFSVSHSNTRSVVKYIQDQEEHHKRVSFQEEFVTFLKKNGIQYDERFIWE